MRKKSILLVIACMSALLAGCELFGGAAKRTFRFENLSSYTIEIIPNGQDWIGFVLFPGDERFVTIDESEIYFVYFESDWYYMSRGSGDSTVFTFFNHTLIDWVFENQSSTTTTIGPQDGENAQDWDSFELAPGESFTLSIPYSHIYLSYGPAEAVSMSYEDSLDKWIIIDD